MEKWTVERLQSNLRIMDILLEKYSYDPPQGVVPFNSTQEMAQYFRQFTKLLLQESPQLSSD